MQRLPTTCDFGFPPIKKTGREIPDSSESPLQKLQNRLRARLHVELLVNRVQVRPHRAQRDAEVLADFLVKISLGEERQNLQLALRQFFHLGSRLLDLLKMTDDFARDLHRH